jgi:hypothetical protein
VVVVVVVVVVVAEAVIKVLYTWVCSQLS